MEEAAARSVLEALLNGMLTGVFICTFSIFQPNSAIRRLYTPCQLDSLTASVCCDILCNRSRRGNRIDFAVNILTRFGLHT